MIGCVGNPAKKPPYPATSLPAVIPAVIAFVEFTVIFPETFAVKPIKLKRL